MVETLKTKVPQTEYLSPYMKKQLRWAGVSEDQIPEMEALRASLGRITVRRSRSGRKPILRYPGAGAIGVAWSRVDGRIEAFREVVRRAETLMDQHAVHGINVIPPSTALIRASYEFVSRKRLVQGDIN